MSRKKGKKKDLKLTFLAEGVSELDGPFIKRIKMGTSKPVPKNYLTHYYLMHFRSGPVVIGEAAEVRRVHKGVWKARVGVWEFDKKLRKYCPAFFSDIGQRTIEMPMFSLVRKEDFKGKVLTSMHTKPGKRTAKKVKKKTKTSH